MPVNRVASAQKVSRVTIWKIKKKHKKYGIDGLKDHKPGRLFEPLNPKFYNLVIQEWKKNKCGARKLHIIFKKKGFGVSLRKISQVMVAEGLQKPCPNRKKPRKYKRYEWPIPNLMWHTDWSWSSVLNKWVIVYIDDCSRRIMGRGKFDNANTKNALFVLYRAIAEHGVVPLMLNSDRGAQFYANKRSKKGGAEHIFENALKDLGIQFIPSRKRHPQTNGKTEKWFGIFKAEYDERFDSFEEFVDWYNSKRLSEAVDYMTPNEAYKKRL